MFSTPEICGMSGPMLV